MAFDWQLLLHEMQSMQLSFFDNCRAPGISATQPNISPIGQTVRQKGR
jgi:hypothetical protein